MPRRIATNIGTSIVVVVYKFKKNEIRNVNKRSSKAFLSYHSKSFKPGLHESQLPIERSVTLVSSIVVEQRRCPLQVSSVARL